MNDLEKIINDAWENKDKVNKNSDKSLIDAINQIIEDLDQGKIRVAEKINNEWITHQHIKKAIMLSFRIHGKEVLQGTNSSLPQPAVFPFTKLAISYQLEYGPCKASLS